MLKEILKEILNFTNTDYIKIKEGLASGFVSKEELMKECYIPLIPSKLDELGYVEENIAFHLTTDQYIKYMLKNQNTNMQISTFTKFDKSLFDIPSIKMGGTPIILKLKGRALIEGNSDLYSKPSDNIRWIKTNYPFSKILYFNIRKIYKETKSCKEYIDKVYDYLDIEGYKYLNKILKNKETPYNEIIMDNFKILGGYSINSLGKDIIEENNIKFLGFWKKI